jgi:tetratricopeptide (TPR) repeat protein
MRAELATALGHLALTMTYATRFDEAWTAAQECRQVAEELGSRAHVAEVLVFPIPTYLLRGGESDAALEAAREGVAIAQAIGDAINMFTGAVTLAALYNSRGDYEKARETAGQVVAAGPQLGDFAPFVLPMALAQVLSASRGLGQSAYEQALLQHAAELAEMEPFMDALACAELGFGALADGNLEQAESRFRRGLDQPSGSWLLERPRLLAGAALVKLARGETLAGLQLVADGRVFAAEREMRHVYPLLDLVDARLSLASGDAWRAVEQFQSAEHAAAALRMGPLVEQARMGAAQARAALA